MATWLTFGLVLAALIGLLSFFSLAIKRRKRDNTEVFLVDVLEGSETMDVLLDSSDTAQESPEQTHKEQAADRHLDRFK
jgi:hypothetical protein